MNQPRTLLGIATIAASFGFLLTGLTGCGSGSASTVAEDDAAPATEGIDLAGYGCDDLATDAARISGEQGTGVELLKVRKAKVVKDKRDTYEAPTGDKSVLVLSCKGTGVWSDGDEETKVLVKLKIDADGTAFVYYEATD